MTSSFTTRAEQAALLLSRLNDDDIADERARNALRTITKSELETCIKLYFAWCSIAITAKKLSDIGYELDPQWEERLTSAYMHIINLCVSNLQVADLAKFNRNNIIIFSNALHLNPYVAVAGYTEELDLKDFL
jgi:hypothetical protein